jgi:hypothetical protein
MAGRPKHQNDGDLPDREARPDETREQADARSIANIDENATSEARSTQSRSDAVDRAAGSPADEGGEA